MVMMTGGRDPKVMGHKSQFLHRSESQDACSMPLVRSGERSVIRVPKP